MIAGLGVNIESLIPLAVELGGHVRVGLEDDLHNSGARNIDLVENAVKQIEKFRGAIATAAEVREALKLIEIGDIFLIN